MNNVQIYSPPRLQALIIAGLFFILYQWGWRPILATSNQWGDPAPLPVAIGATLIMGYGAAMLIWLVRQTKGQKLETFRPTRGRIIAAFCLTMVTPLVVFSWLPWIVGGTIPFLISPNPLQGIGIILAGMCITYPLAAMIVRHTYQRHWLRFGLCALFFWTGYAFHILWHGAMVFTL